VSQRWNGTAWQTLDTPARPLDSYLRAVSCPGSADCLAIGSNDGVPVTDLAAIVDDGTTGTTVHFRPDGALRAGGGLTADELVRLAASWRDLPVEDDDGRAD
jgi:hypothetical protein